MRNTLVGILAYAIYTLPSLGVHQRLPAAYVALAEKAARVVNVPRNGLARC